jgi:hypothetical protein
VPNSLGIKSWLMLWFRNKPGSGQPYRAQQRARGPHLVTENGLIRRMLVIEYCSIREPCSPWDGSTAGSSFAAMVRGASPFSVDLRNSTFRNSRRIANLDVRLQALVSPISEKPSLMRRALSGQCLNVGLMEGPGDENSQLFVAGCASSRSVSIGTLHANVMSARKARR